MDPTMSTATSTSTLVDVPPPAPTLYQQVFTKHSAFGQFERHNTRRPLNPKRTRNPKDWVNGYSVNQTQVEAPRPKSIFDNELARKLRGHVSTSNADATSPLNDTILSPSEVLNTEGQAEGNVGSVVKVIGEVREESEQGEGEEEDAEPIVGPRGRMSGLEALSIHTDTEHMQPCFCKRCNHKVGNEGAFEQDLDQADDMRVAVGLDRSRNHFSYVRTSTSVKDTWNLPQLSMFMHTDGAQMCKGLYKHFTLPNGKQGHFYHALKKVVDEVEVGLEGPPFPPQTLQDCMLDHLPACPQVFTLAMTKPPVPVVAAHRPSPELPPTPQHHTLDVEPHSCPGSGPCPQMGCMPLHQPCFVIRETRVTTEVILPPKPVEKKKKKKTGDKRLVGVEEEEELEEEEQGEMRGLKQETSEKQVVEWEDAESEDEENEEETEAHQAAAQAHDQAWTLQSSTLWGPRLQDCDSHSFLDSSRVYTGAFEADWNHMCSKPAFTKLMVTEGSGYLSLNQIRDVLWKHHLILARTYTFFSYRPATPQDLCGHVMFLQEFKTFAQACYLLDQDGPLRLQTLDVLLSQTLARDPSSPEASDLEKVLTRPGFLEILVRIAIEKYFKPAICDDVAASLAALLDKDLLHVLPREVFVDPNTFRHARLYTASMERQLLKYRALLEALFDYYTVKGSRGVTMPRLLTLLKQAKLLGVGQRVKEAVEKEAKSEAQVCFLWSHMFVLDEAESAERSQISTDGGQLSQLPFTGFLEFFARLADTLSLPNKEELIECGVQTGTLIEYQTQLSINEKFTPLDTRESAGFSSKRSRPLEDKMHRLLRYMAHNLCLVYKVNTDPKHLVENLVKYLNGLSEEN
mmetsp:Transcript_3078/g.4142  ORF Transcript_3078/g.4142 Transcript_3078/m.4142 type:complete len:855 (-) Transcript_3078:68-2632(-)